MRLRSLFVHVLGASFLLPATVGAQLYPAKPLRLIVPFPPGGGNDLVGRIIGKHLAERLGQPVVIDNRPGADGIIGINYLKALAPDGYAVAVGSIGPLAVNQTLYAKPPYDTLRDFAPIAKLVDQPLLLVVHPTLPVANVRDLIALAKQKPGQLSYASTGAGSAAHLSGELFNSMAGVQIVHIPYKGSAPAVLDTISGQVQLTYGASAVTTYVRSGRLKALAVGSTKPLVSMPDVPPISESVPGYESYAWVGMVAPANTPKDIVARLSREIIQILNQKDVMDALLLHGNVAATLGPEEFSAYIKAEIAKWGAVVKSAKITFD